MCRTFGNYFVFMCILYFFMFLKYVKNKMYICFFNIMVYEKILYILVFLYILEENKRRFKIFSLVKCISGGDKFFEIY